MKKAYDLVASMEAATKAAADLNAVKFTVLKSESAIRTRWHETTNSMKKVSEVEAKLVDMSQAAREKAKRLAWQDFAGLATILIPADVFAGDIESLVSALKTLRYKEFEDKYADEIEAAGDTYLDRNGKAQPIRIIKDNTLKFGSHPITLYQFNVHAKFLEGVKNHGWDTVVPKGKVLSQSDVNALNPTAGGSSSGNNGSKTWAEKVDIATNTLKRCIQGLAAEDLAAADKAVMGLVVTILPSTLADAKVAIEAAKAAEETEE